MLQTKLHHLPITRLHLLHLHLHRQPHSLGDRQDQGPSLKRARLVEILFVPTPSTAEIVAPDCAKMDTRVIIQASIRESSKCAALLH